MTREEWIGKAAEKLKPFMGDESDEYAASLYETYVVEDGTDGYADDPAGAVDEDMSYWND